MRADQLDLLSVANHPRKDAERDRIDAAILYDGRTHGGSIDQGRIRTALSNRHGLGVDPRLLSARYSVLARAGLIRRTGWHPNTDTAGGNAGKMQPRWEIA